MSTTLLQSYENAPPLPEGYNVDGKSLINIPGPRSPCYDAFPEPFMKNKNGFDFHGGCAVGLWLIKATYGLVLVYYRPHINSETTYAKELHERIRREFPELRIYRLWDKPVGPHSTAMFEVNVFDPHQTGSLFSFLAVNRGPCSVLIHPNTGNALEDHTTLATWMGEKWPLNLDIFNH